MPHQHDHNCNHESHDHDHDHSGTSGLGPQDNLFMHIDRDNVVALNANDESKGSDVIKPWHLRLSEEKVIRPPHHCWSSSKLLGHFSSSSLTQTINCTEAHVENPGFYSCFRRIIRIPFTGSVKLRSLLLKTGPTDQTPAKVSLFANEDNLDFSDAADKTPTQEFDVAQGREVGEYVVKYYVSFYDRIWLLTDKFRTAKFSNVSSLTLYFPEGQGADSIRIYYVGFLGTWTERKSNPVITVYEAQANLADHQKIQGTEGAFNTPQI
ncbi:hypothetical protein D9758_004069 [Tetrapyrgos nigripes]|uniref:PITH domain-containing protein n=1 Tax=Tetrapyrgos nigripes TaxID=182062 RepID=A0A8H5GLJ2_9AGAR|nr:hypothetical protein D9758_004069 [Tetrapyrgos nigripes]